MTPAYPAPPATPRRGTSGRDFLALAREAAEAMQALLAEAIRRVRAKVTIEGRASDRLYDREQRATHGLAWLATYVEAVRQLASYTDRLQARGRFGEVEELV